MNYLRRNEHSLLTNDTVLATAATVSSESSQECRRQGAGSWATLFLMVNATLGAGLLNFPQAFDKSGGVLTAISTQLVFLVFITAAIIILAQCSDTTNSCSMQDTLAGLCGPRSLTLCGICVALYSFGCCITFLIIIGDQFDRLLATFWGTDFCHYWYLSRAFTTTLSCCVFILPLCFSKRLDVLSYASSLGCVAAMYVVWLIIYRNIIDIGPAKPVRHRPDHWTEVFQVVPVVCFGYQCHMSVIPMYACMKDRNLLKFSGCAVASMLVCFMAYTMAGIFGYATFGTGMVPDDILEGYSGVGATLTIAVVAIALKNFTTYPIILFCGREAVLGLCSERLRSIVWPRVVLSLVWIGLTLVVAILVPDISPVINLMGSLSAAFIFIIPGICLLQSILLRDPLLCLNKDKFMIVFAIFMVALGAFVCGEVLVESVRDFHAESSPPPIVTGFKLGLTQSLCT